MPYHLEFDFRNRILLIVMEGDVVGREIERIKDAIRDHVASLAPLAGITDMSEVKSFNVESHSMRTAALQPSPYPDETPRFIVAPTDYLFGMGRMYELVADRPGGKLRVVRRREDALAAIGVKDPKFERVS